MALFHIVPRVIFKINSNMGFIAHYKFPKCPRTPWDHFLVGRIEEMKLGFCHLNYKSFFMNTWTKSITMLHNPHFSGIKLVFHSIINSLHNWLCPYSNSSSFVQTNLPFWGESNIFILVKQALCTKSASWAPNLFYLSTLHPKSQRDCV